MGEPQVPGRPEIGNGACEGDGRSAGPNGQAFSALHFQRGKIKLDVGRRKRIAWIGRYENLKADERVWLLEYDLLRAASLVIF